MDRNELIVFFQDTLTLSLSSALKDVKEQASQSASVYFENFHTEKIRRNLSAYIIVEDNTTFQLQRNILLKAKLLCSISLIR